MLKRKVSAIWILILAVITAAACIFATVIYIRYGRQTPNKARELGQFRFLKAESDSAGVSFEVISVREVGSDVVLDLRWVNNSGNPIAYGEAYELYRLKDGKWEKIDTKLFSRYMLLYKQRICRQDFLYNTGAYRYDRRREISSADRISIPIRG